MYHTTLDPVTESFCYKVALREEDASVKELTKAENLKASKKKDKDSESTTHEGRNFATCGVLVTYSMNSDIDTQQVAGEHHFFAPYRDTLTVYESIDPQVFVSCERKYFCETFRNVSKVKYHNECDECEIYKTRADKMKCVTLDTRKAHFFEAFGFTKDKQWRDFVNGTKPDSPEFLLSRIDDSEQQIIAELDRKLEGILSETFKVIPSGAIVHVRCVVHTKYDPCPFCLGELLSYFNLEFLAGIQSAMVGKDFLTMFAVPVVSSRLYYAHKRQFSSRERLPWKGSYDFERFAVNIDDMNELNWPGNYGAPVVLHALCKVKLEAAKATKEVENKAMCDLIHQATDSLAFV